MSTENTSTPASPQPGKEKKFHQILRKFKNRKTPEERQRALFARYGIDPQEAPSQSSVIQQVITVFMRRLLPLILMCILLFVFLCGYFYVRSSDSAAMVMTLNYEESSKGLNPNGTRFNIYDLSSEQVLSRAIEYAGLQGVITPDDLSERLSATETTTKNAADYNYYITTSYNIRFAKPKEVTDIQTEDLLKLICKAYKDTFYNSYTINTSILSQDYSDIKNLEYSEAGSLFSMRASQIGRYLNMRSNEKSAFTSEKTGETFQSLGKLLANLKDYQIADYNAYIWENGIVKDADNYKATLSYVNSQLGKEQTIMRNEFEIRKHTVNVFRDAMGTSILVPTLNNKQEFYMARTKTGVDYLASEADYYLSTSESVKQRITKNKDRLSKVNTPASEEVKTADTMIEKILAELNRIENLVMTTDKEYMAQKTRNYLTFDLKTQGTVSKLHLPKTIALTGLFFLIAMLAYYHEYKKALTEARVK